MQWLRKLIRHRIKSNTDNTIRYIPTDKKENTHTKISKHALWNQRLGLLRIYDVNRLGHKYTNIFINMNLNSIWCDWHMISALLCSFFHHLISSSHLIGSLVLYLSIWYSRFLSLIYVKQKRNIVKWSKAQSST